VAAFTAKRKSLQDEMKISERDAAQFASYVLNGVNIVRREFVKDAKQGNLVDHAVHGLYRPSTRRCRMASPRSSPKSRK